MAKQRKRASSRPGRQASQASAQPEPIGAKPDRRDALKRLRNGVLILAGGGASTWYISSEVRADILEADLSRIGNGTPTIVQIHDPQCPVCRALQHQARKALEHFEDGELQYLVANIRQAKGKRLAARHGVRHVTLLLLDGQGQRTDVLTGPNDSQFLVRAFRRHLHGDKQDKPGAGQLVAPG